VLLTIATIRSIVLPPVDQTGNDHLSMPPVPPPVDARCDPAAANDPARKARNRQESATCLSPHARRIEDLSSQARAVRTSRLGQACCAGVAPDESGATSSILSHSAHRTTVHRLVLESKPPCSFCQRSAQMHDAIIISISISAAIIAKQTASPFRRNSMREIAAADSQRRCFRPIDFRRLKKAPLESALADPNLQRSRSSGSMHHGRLFHLLALMSRR
jgi:hypothetical protein